MSFVDPGKLEKVKQRKWFYRFDLPDGTSTQSDVPEHILKIHTSRSHHLRQIIQNKVIHSKQMTAIDFACHEGFFSIELAKHFAVVHGFEFRTESLTAARLITDLLGVPNVNYVNADLQQMNFKPELGADFVLVFGLIYHMEDPIHVIRLASQFSRRYILIESQVVPYDISGRVEDGSYENQRQTEGVFALVRDYPQAHTGGSTELALVPSLNALLFLLREFGFTEIEVLTPDLDDYEQFRRGSRVIVYGEKKLAHG